MKRNRCVRLLNLDSLGRCFPGHLYTIPSRNTRLYHFYKAEPQQALAASFMLLMLILIPPHAWRLTKHTPLTGLNRVTSHLFISSSKRGAHARLNLEIRSEIT